MSTLPAEAPRADASQRGGFGALTQPAFRLYFAGQLVSVTGTWMQQVAQQLVVYQLTGSDLALGLVACAQGLPALLLTPFAGVLVERYPKRRLLLITQAGLMLIALTTAGLQFAGTLGVLPIMLLSLGVGAANALDAPTRQTFIVEMTGKDHLSSGIVLQSLMFNTARVFGPAVAGLTLRAVGPAWCFLLNGLSFFAVLLSLLIMHVNPVPLKTGHIEILRPLREGVRFARTHPIIRPLLLFATVVSAFGITFTVLVAPYADQLLTIAPDMPAGFTTEDATSALFAAQGVGTLFASLLLTRISVGARRGRVLLVAAVVAPLTVIGLGFAQSFALALLLTAVAGGGFVCEFVLCNTIIQAHVSDEYRGRVLSLFTLTFFGLSPFGSLLLGGLAEGVGTAAAIMVCAGLCLGGTLAIIVTAPGLWRVE